MAPARRREYDGGHAPRLFERGAVRSSTMMGAHRALLAARRPDRADIRLSGNTEEEGEKGMAMEKFVRARDATTAAAPGAGTPSEGYGR
jgi:hypothetical protein